MVKREERNRWRKTLILSFILVQKNSSLDWMNQTFTAKSLEGANTSELVLFFSRDLYSVSQWHFWSIFRRKYKNVIGWKNSQEIHVSWKFLDILQKYRKNHDYGNLGLFVILQRFWGTFFCFEMPRRDERNLFLYFIEFEYQINHLFFRIRSSYLLPKHFLIQVFGEETKGVKGELFYTLVF